jgi:hypothetical protein
MIDRKAWYKLWPLTNVKLKPRQNLNCAIFVPRNNSLHSHVYVLTTICGVHELLVRVQRGLLASFGPHHTTLARDSFDCGHSRQKWLPAVPAVTFAAGSA